MGRIRSRAQDGTRIVHYTDSEGRSQAREEPNYITVHFECFYTYGVVTVKGNSDKEMAPGFKAGMGYADGTGEAWLPNTRVMHKCLRTWCTTGPNPLLELSLIANLSWDFPSKQVQKRDVKAIYRDGMSILDNFFPSCFNRKFQIWFTIRLSFREELGSIVHHILNIMQ